MPPFCETHHQDYQRVDPLPGSFMACLACLNERSAKQSPVPPHAAGEEQSFSDEVPNLPHTSPTASQATPEMPAFVRERIEIYRSIISRGYDDIAVVCWLADRVKELEREAQEKQHTITDLVRVNETLHQQLEHP
jgi:hypothetical protein